jgi:hypothetical protein
MTLPSTSVLVKCSSTLFCYLHSALLWLVVLFVFLLGVLRQRVGRPTHRVEKANSNGNIAKNPVS